MDKNCNQCLLKVICIYFHVFNLKNKKKCFLPKDSQIDYQLFT